MSTHWLKLRKVLKFLGAVCAAYLLSGMIVFGFFIGGGALREADYDGQPYSQLLVGPGPFPLFCPPT